MHPNPPEIERETLERAEVQLQRLASLIGPNVPAGWGFVTIFATLGGPGYSCFVGSIERRGTVALLRELADQLETGAREV